VLLLMLVHLPVLELLLLLVLALVHGLALV
jgi:hypothetical protein